MNSTQAPSPPGTNGLPLIGETLAFVQNSFGFIDERVARYGPVFKTSILGRQAVILASADACEAWLDTGRCVRAGAMPTNIRQLFAGPSLPMLDDAEHKARKTLVLKGFTDDALAAYLPIMQATVERYLERWVAPTASPKLDDFKRLAIEVICANVMGILPGTLMDTLLLDYTTIVGGLTALPLPLPGTRYTKALAARDRVLAAFDPIVKAHRAQPTEDGLSRMLQARTAEGVQMSDAEAAFEVHHIVLAGYIIFAEFAGLLVQIGRDPAVGERLDAVIAAHSPEGPITLETLAAMPFLNHVVLETKRITPIVPGQFAKARTDFEMHGVTVPAGAMLLLALRPILMDKAIYTDPERFDPDRFAPERAEHLKHPHGYCPQGPGNAMSHKCPGTDYASVFMAVFILCLRRHYTCSLPPQNLAFDWSTTPPVPADGLRMHLSRSAPVPTP